MRNLGRLLCILVEWTETTIDVLVLLYIWIGLIVLVWHLGHWRSHGL